MPNIGTARVAFWYAFLSSDGQRTTFLDTLLTMRFSDSQTTVNLWTHANDSLSGDLIDLQLYRDSGWIWITFKRTL